MFLFENHCSDGTTNDGSDDTMIITIGIQPSPLRDRRISSECEEMLQELYNEITVNCCDEDDNIDDEEFVRDSDDESIKHAIKTDYEWNYTMPILTHICGFYGLKKRGTKREIIESIVEFETTPVNEDIVKHRKQIFEFMRLIKENEYMKRFILFP
jgi:hypothetical protein